jgi:membrane protease YdiL (CAAX protease family)
MSSIYFTDHLIAAILMIVAPMYTLLRRRPRSIGEMVFDTRIKISLYVSNSLFQWGIVVVVLLAWVLQGHPLKVMGLQLPNLELWPWVIAVTLLFWGAYAWNTWRQTGTPEALAETRAQWREKTPFMPASTKEYRWFILMAVTAGICEEILFRGFLMTYLQALSYGSPKYQSMVVSSAVFAVLHIYQGRVAALKIFAFSMIFGALYILTNSILISILVHALVDLASGWIGWKVILKEKSGGDS